MKRELIETVEQLTPDQLEGAIVQLEGVMEALPPDVESGTDAHIRYGVEALIAGYRIGSDPKSTPDIYT